MRSALIFFVSEATLRFWTEHMAGRFSAMASRFAITVHTLISRYFQKADPALAGAYLDRRFGKIFRSHLEDLGSMPVLTKSELKRRIASEPPDFPTDRYLAADTSGSTGEPLKIFWDRKYSPLNVASYCRLFLEAGSDLQEGKLCIGVRSIYWERPENVFAFSSADLYRNPGVISDFFRKNERLMRHIEIIEGYPSHFFALYDLLKKENIPIPGFKLLISTGEELSLQDREKLETRFGGNAYGFYGLTETGIVGSECKKKHGFHVDVARHVVEITDDEGKKAPTGTWGRILVTAVDNEVMPLARYDTGDMGNWLPEKCECGRTSPRFLLIGRQNEEIALGDGEKTHAFLIRPVLQKYADYIERFQIVSHAGRDLELKIVPADSYSEAAGKEISDGLKRALNGRLPVVIRLVKNIPPDPGGKHRVFVAGD